ncbi:MAG TPA: class I SAM-dependent rRNA methyltransferase [Myxococcota bacterium]|nr:class I SAM-dependent rRNA methyltransferase [Myxococcota bacterium]
MARPYTKPRPGTDDAVVVDGYSEQWLRQGFCWVYPKEVTRRPKRLKPGMSVAIRARSGQPLGAGIWDEGWIAVRRFREEMGPIDAALIGEYLDKARALRDALIDPATTAYRLANAENDGLPGIRVDIYGHFAAITLDSPSLRGLAEVVADWLSDRLSPRGIFLAWRPDPRETRAGDLADQLLRGHAPTSPVRVTERGVACLVDPGAGKDIGLFTDMRDNRAWLEPHWGGARVLNLFAHTGMFSVCAALHGATEVVSVDLSEAFLDRAEANFAANDLDPGDHTFLPEDVRRVLDRLRRQGERFGRVVLDPPSFSHGPAGPWSAKKDYARMVAACVRVLEPGGWLIAALNLGEVSPKDFHTSCRQGARKAGRQLQLLYDGGQAADHPALASFPEGRYLKFAVYRAL